MGLCEMWRWWIPSPRRRNTPTLAAAAAIPSHKLSRRPLTALASRHSFCRLQTTCCCSLSRQKMVAVMLWEAERGLMLWSGGPSQESARRYHAICQHATLSAPFTPSSWVTWVPRRSTSSASTPRMASWCPTACTQFPATWVPWRSGRS